MASCPARALSTELFSGQNPCVEPPAVGLTTTTENHLWQVSNPNSNETQAADSNNHQDRPKCLGRVQYPPRPKPLGTRGPPFGPPTRGGWCVVDCGRAHLCRPCRVDGQSPKPHLTKTGDVVNFESLTTESINSRRWLAPLSMSTQRAEKEIRCKSGAVPPL